MSEALFATNGLTKRYGGLVACRSVCLTLHQGELIGLIGPNGAGKTTCFNLITGADDPTEGSIQFCGEDVTTARDYEMARKGVARTFQNIRLFPAMSVLENLLVAQHNRLMRASLWSIAGLLGLGVYRRAEREAVELGRYWLERIGLVDRADRPAGDLPYGAQRRLEIARAMCTLPRLLCLDEPAAGLNPRETQELNDLLRFIRDEHGAGILLIEHDMSMVMQISDRIVVLDYGRKIAEGDPAAVRGDPAVIRAYLGEEDDGDDDAPEGAA